MIEAVGPGLKKVSCPHFELQPGPPSSRCVSIHLPRANLDKEELFKAHNTDKINGGMLTVIHQYLWDMALMIERCLTDTVDIIDWAEHRLPNVELSRTLSSICRHARH